MGLEGVWIVNCTKNHMREGLEGWEKLKVWVEEGDNRETWASLMNQFRALIGDERVREYIQNIHCRVSRII
jgi:hypothetical protein